MERLSPVLPYGKRHGKTMAKPDLPCRLDNGTNIRTNGRTYVDSYSPTISSYESNAHARIPKFFSDLSGSHAMVAASRDRATTPDVVIHRPGELT